MNLQNPWSCMSFATAKGHYLHMSLLTQVILYWCWACEIYRWYYHSLHNIRYDIVSLYYTIWPDNCYKVLSRNSEEGPSRKGLYNYHSNNSNIAVFFSQMKWESSQTACAYYRCFSFTQAHAFVSRRDAHLAPLHSINVNGEYFELNRCESFKYKCLLTWYRVWDYSPQRKGATIYGVI